MNEKHFVIVLGQSKWLLIYLVAVHIIMLATLMSLLADIGPSLIAIVIISASFIFYCQRYQWIKHGRSIIKVVCDDKNDWQIYYSDGNVNQKLALKHGVVTAQLIILRFSAISFWHSKSVTIMADAVDADLFRALRVHLRRPSRDIKTFQQ